MLHFVLINSIILSLLYVRTKGKLQTYTQIPVSAANIAHHEQDSRQWGQALNLHHAEDLGHVTLAATHIEETSSGEEDAVDATKGGQGHKDGHDPPHEPIQPLGEHLKYRHRLFHNYESYTVFIAGTHCKF